MGLKAVRKMLLGLYISAGSQALLPGAHFFFLSDIGGICRLAFLTVLCVAFCCLLVTRDSRN